MYPVLLKFQERIKSHMMEMLVVVGSKNPVKIKATKSVFRERYGECKVIGKPVNTGLPDQPIGLSQIMEGAVRRARQAIKALPDADFSVGIEAGLIEIPCEGTRYFDQQFAAILDSDGWLTLGGGPAFEYPCKVAKQILSLGEESGKVFASLSGVPNIGRKQGVIGYISKRSFSRRSITELAISMALLPRIRHEIYRQV